LVLAKVAESPLYIVHVMCELAIKEIEKAKERGQRVVGEPVLSGLTLDESKKSYKHRCNV
jgi:dihydropyrimidinase